MVKDAALRAWSAAAVPPLAQVLLQQGWGQVARQGCAVAGPVGLAAGFACLVLLAVGVYVAWPARRATDTSRFVAIVAMGESVFFGVAILFQILAGIIVPPCWR